MDAHFSVDDGGVGDRRRCRYRHQARDSARSPIGKIGAALGWSALQHKISRVSIRPCRRIDGVFWCFDFCAPPRRFRLSGHPGSDWVFPNVPWRALLVRCFVRGTAGDCLCGRRLAILRAREPANHRSISTPRFLSQGARERETARIKARRGVRFELTRLRGRGQCYPLYAWQICTKFFRGRTLINMDGTTRTVAAAPMDPEFVDPDGLRRGFGIKRSLAYRLLSDGLIKGVSLRCRGAKRGKRLFSVDSVRVYLNSQLR